MLSTERQNELLPEGQTNATVVFRSCYPDNACASVGREPGDPDSCERTGANAKAAYRALLPYFTQHPDVLIRGRHRVAKAFVPFLLDTRRRHQASS